MMTSVYSPIRSWWLALALIAVLFRGLVPIGYMPDFGAQHSGLMPLRICTGDSFAVIKVSAERYGKAPAVNHRDKHHINTPCDFALSHGFGFANAPIALFILLAFILLAFASHYQLSFSPRRYFSPMAARAPPLFS